MKSISLARLSVLVVFCLCGGLRAVESSKPVINPNQEELIIQEGDELRLECHGKDEVHFSRQRIRHTSGSEYTILENDESNTKTFVINATKKEDTRWYACADSDTVITWNDENNIDDERNDIARIYVYVNSSEPFASGLEPDSISGVAGGKFIVPCRSTSPNVSVSLEINWGRIGIPANTTYDPKIGFIIPEISRQYSGGNFKCVVRGPPTVRVTYVTYVSSD